MEQSTALARYVGDADLVVDTARTRDDVRRIRREVEGRRWAARHGIPTADVVASDPAGRWLVSRRVLDESGEPAYYVEAALEMSRRIQSLPHPRFDTVGNTWRAPRRSFALRLSRLVRAGIPLREVSSARRAFARLPHDVTVHNDYHRENVLNRGVPGGVTVIDWEFTSVGPRHQDMVRLIVDIHDAAAAYDAWRLLVGSVPARERPALAVLLRWLTIRTYCSEVVVAPAALDPVKSAHRRERWLQARQWAADVAHQPEETR